MGCCRNCCVLLFKLGCQFKDHIICDSFADDSDTSPDHLLIFLKDINLLFS